MEHDFDECIAKALETAAVIELEEETLDKIRELTEKIVKRKAAEQHHMVDNQKETKRFMTGFKGEAALEKLLGIPVIDWSVGDSKTYHKPDIAGYNVGIKTVEYGKFPVIFKENYYPQIICVLDRTNPDRVYVCGLGLPEVLNQYQDDSLILDSRLRERGTKTGFYGFDHLTPVSDLSDLKNYKKGRRYNPGERPDLRKSRAGKICPWCKREMRIRSGKFGEFWGCQGYPDCKYKENI